MLHEDRATLGPKLLARLPQGAEPFRVADALPKWCPKTRKKRMKKMRNRYEQAQARTSGPTEGSPSTAGEFEVHGAVDASEDATAGSVRGDPDGDEPKGKGKKTGPGAQAIFTPPKKKHGDD